MKVCETCAASFIGPMACQTCEQGVFMGQREPYDKELKAVLTQESRQKFAMDLLYHAEMCAGGEITTGEYIERTWFVLKNMNAEIREKTGGCHG